MSELSKSSLLKVFKGYISRLTAHPTTSVVTTGEAVSILELTIARCELLNQESELMKPKQLVESKIDVSGSGNIFEVHNEMAFLLNHFAEWETAEIEACDEPCAARASRLLLEKYGLKE